MDKGHTIKVLDHGYVKFVDSMGSDEAIVEAARMSTGRGFVSWEHYRRCKRCDLIAFFDSVVKNRMISETGAEIGSCGGIRGGDVGEHDWQDFPRGDLGILEYLYRNRHTSPFEMCELIIDVQVPMDCWRQWIRHRTASVNEYSTRYTEAINLMAQTSHDAWRTQGVTNRQGSGAFIGERCVPEDARGGSYLSVREEELHKLSREVYEERLEMGVAKEQARKDLPLSTYTAARWKCDLKNVLHFLGLRMHPHAQLEIRQYANAVAEMVKSVWPRTYALFEEHDLHGVHLSRTEAATLAALVNPDQVASVDFDVRKAALAKLGLKVVV